MKDNYPKSEVPMEAPLTQQLLHALNDTADRNAELLDQIEKKLNYLKSKMTCSDSEDGPHAKAEVRPEPCVFQELSDASHRLNRQSERLGYLLDWLNEI